MYCESVSERKSIENYNTMNGPGLVLTHVPTYTTNYTSEVYQSVYMALGGGRLPLSTYAKPVPRTECFYQQYNLHLQHQGQSAIIPVVLGGPPKARPVSSDNDSAYGSLPTSPRVSPKEEISALRSLSSAKNGRQKVPS